MKKLTLALSVLSLGLASSFSQAAPQKVSGFYLGNSIGASTLINFVDQEYIDKYPNLDINKTNDTSTYVSFQFLAGYQFNRIIAAELVYTHFGILEKDGKTAFKPQAVTAQANVGYTFHSGWRPFALLGLSSVNLHQQDNYFEDYSKTAARIGAGVDFAPVSLRGVSFRATWTIDSFNSDYSKKDLLGRETDYTDTNILGNLSIGATYKF